MDLDVTVIQKGGAWTLEVLDKENADNKLRFFDGVTIGEAFNDLVNWAGIKNRDTYTRSDTLGDITKDIRNYTQNNPSAQIKIRTK